MIKLLSDKWHIEDQIRPALGRKVNLTLDMATDETVLIIPLLKDIEKHVIGLKVYGVNLGRELTFFKENNHLIIDLGDLNRWTCTPDQEGLYKVRLNVKFTVKDPRFELSRWDLGYTSTFEVDGYMLDKGSLTLPPGLKLARNRIQAHASLKCKDGEIKQFSLNSEADYVTKKDKGKNYVFLMDPESIEMMKSEECASSIKICYQAVNERIYYLISIIGFALLLVSLLRFYALVTGDPKLQFDIRFLAASVAFLGLIMGLVREGYELPFRRMVFIAILFLVVDLGLEIILLK
ncbi:MAG: hypothetical protein HVN35_04225 [Methanobacteriaceae archaeon]|nr:hypothetical protein [Methanobacteriaceae archaeon]